MFHQVYAPQFAHLPMVRRHAGTVEAANAVSAVGSMEAGVGLALVPICPVI